MSKAGSIGPILILVAAIMAVWFIFREKPPFQVGQRVKSVDQPSLLGMVVAVRSNPSGGWNVDVQWDDGTFVSYGGDLAMVIVAV